MFRKFVAIATCGFLFSVAEATSPQPVVETTPEGAVSLTFADGRKAVVQTFEVAPRSLPVQMQMTENMCAPEHGRPSCTLVLRVGIKRFALTWTQHPDSSRVGQIVNFLVKDSAFTVFDVSQNVNENLGKDVFACDNFGWLHAGHANEVSRHALILSWGSETNFPNIETGVNENMTVGGAFNVTLSGRFGRYYGFEATENILLFDGGFPLVSSGPITMTLREPRTSELCQVQFGPDLTKTIKVSGDLVAELGKAKPITIPLTKGLRARAIGQIKARIGTGEFQ